MNAKSLPIDSDTVRLRLPDTEEDWNFVRSVYMRDYWDGGLERAVRPTQALRRAVQVALNGTVPNRVVKKLANNLEPSIIPLLRPPEECQVAKPVFDSHQYKIRDRIIENSQVWLACSPVDTWFLMGFAIVVRAPSGIVLHYLYVKKKFRKMGIGSALLEAMCGENRYIVATHVTHDWTKWAPSLVAHGYQVEFNPYLLDSPLFTSQGD